MASDTTTTRPCPVCAHPEPTLRLTEQEFRIVRCTRCRLTYLANPPNDKRFYDDYHESAAAYRSEDYHAVSPNPALAELWHINTQRIAAIQRLKPSGELLDIGCGRGFFLQSAADSGYSVQGTDISQAAVTFAHESFDIAASTDSLNTLLEQGRRFDIITLWHVLEHFADPVAELRKIHQLLADNGVCVVEVPNLNSVLFRFSRQKWHGGNHPQYHRTFFTGTTLSSALHRAGFADITRLRLHYRIPGRSPLTELAKRVINFAALDSFLDFSAQK